MEVLLLSTHNCVPRKGQHQATYFIFLFLKYKLKNGRTGRILFENNIPDCVDSRFVKDDWRDIYGELEENIPWKSPNPTGKLVKLICYVEAYHAVNLANQTFHNGTLIYLHNDPIVWFYNNQDTVESSTFVSEVIVMRLTVEMIGCLIFKLWVIGVPLYSPTNVFYYKHAVVNISQRPDARFQRSTILYVTIKYVRR